MAGAQTISAPTNNHDGGIVDIYPSMRIAIGADAGFALKQLLMGAQSSA